ncbi:hypothetical protein [Vibrio owensii]|uniref:hypothetical protein n=1 Tax=Vibrio owensii TaxID=696485 RepID=UPI0018F1099D|nr:hypothetical protein [Vibrio owensii]
MKSTPYLVDGKTYRFLIDGQTHYGTFKQGSDGKEGALICSDSTAHQTTKASNIERLYSECELNETIGAMVADSLVITDQSGNTVDYDWREGVVELQGQLTPKQP